LGCYLHSGGVEQKGRNVQTTQLPLKKGAASGRLLAVTSVVLGTERSPTTCLLASARTYLLDVEISFAPECVEELGEFFLSESLFQC